MSSPAFAYGVVIVPPPDITRQLMELRQRHPLLRSLAPPHITAKSPFLLRHSAARVRESLEAICEGFAPFELALGSVGQFGTSVLYLDVLDSGALRALNQRLVEGLDGLVETLNGRWDGPGFSPHLTLAERLCADDLPPLKRTLSGLRLRRRFLVERLHLLRGQGKWDLTRGFDLLGEPAD